MITNKLIGCSYEESEQDWRKRIEDTKDRSLPRKRCRTLRSQTIRYITWRGIPDVPMYHCDVCGTYQWMPEEALGVIFKK